MADHRRVEPRGIVGTGMSTDPERIREIEEEAARKGRSWRERGELGFGDVLRTAPARGALEDDAQDDAEDEQARSRRARGADVEPDDDGRPAADQDAGSAREGEATDGHAPHREPGADGARQGQRPTRTGRPPLPPRPPDPRAAQLHRALDQTLDRALPHPRAPSAAGAGKKTPR